MPTIAGNCMSAGNGGNEIEGIVDVKPEKSYGGSTPMKRRSTFGGSISTPSPIKWKSPRRCLNSTPTTLSNEFEKDSTDKPLKSHKSAVKILSNSFVSESKWNPRVTKQMSAVKEAMHVSMAPSTVVCREDEQNRVLEFCKTCVQQEKGGSLYVCGIPGTGKSLSIEKVKQQLLNWAGEEGFQTPDVLSITCTSLTKPSEIFTKILENYHPQKKIKGSISPLQSLQKMYSQKHQSSGMKMMVIIADELDYLITKDRAVLHDLFMLTTSPYSRCLLIGIANAIDLADRFLPKLLSLNCKPMVITFRAYSNDQILKILQQRLKVFPYTVFHPQALELCARKVAATSGDMRRALCVCRSAIETLETELSMNISTVEYDQQQQIVPPAHDLLMKQENDIVRVDHMVVALSKTFKSPIVDIIQSLPQHQQILLCSAVKFFRGGKKDTTVGELNKYYMEICKSTSIPPVGIFELSSMCRMLSDQGLVKLGQSKDDKLRRVTLKVDEADVTFALQEIRYFRNCLQ